MIQFNELRVTPDGKTLVIDAQVIHLPYYEGVYIDKIVIDTQDTFTTSGPSLNPVYSFQVPETLTESFIKQEVINPGFVTTLTSDHANTKRIRKELTVEDFLPGGFTDNLFFVYIITKGTPTTDTPCGWDLINNIGVTANFLPLYQSTLSYLRGIDESCSLNEGFIDLTLRLRALELSIQTGHYTEASRYWTKFFKGKLLTPPVSNTTCNG